MECWSCTSDDVRVCLDTREAYCADCNTVLGKVSITDKKGKDNFENIVRFYRKHPYKFIELLMTDVKIRWYDKLKLRLTYALSKIF